MTLQQAIQFIRENKPQIVNDKETLVVEYEDEYTIRRIIVSNTIIEEDRVIEKNSGQKGSIHNTTQQTKTTNHHITQTYGQTGKRKLVKNIPTSSRNNEVLVSDR
jgi:hypothetical protein